MNTCGWKGIERVYRNSTNQIAEDVEETQTVYFRIGTSASKCLVWWLNEKP